jgi:hypothetical protein
LYFKDLSNPIIHEIDTRQNTTLTVFDGSRDDESKLAKQFWNSVVLMPPVESTLVCKEIKQRTRSRPLNDGTNKRMFRDFNFPYEFLFYSKIPCCYVQR